MNFEYNFKFFNLYQICFLNDVTTNFYHGLETNIFNCHKS